MRASFMPAAGLLLLASCAAPPPANTAPASCTLQIDADFPVTYTAYAQPIVTIIVNKHPMKMLLDTGSENSYLFNEAYFKSGINQTYNSDGDYAVGLGGTVELTAYVIQNLKFGAVVLHDEILGIDPTAPPMKDGQPVYDGVMGYDIMQQFNIGLDLPHNRITFYDLQTCPAAQTPWAGDYAPEDFTQPKDGSPTMAIQINNQNFQLALDTGAEMTMVSSTALNRTGVTPEAGAGQKTEKGTGAGDLSFGLHHVNFSTVSIGAESFSDAPMEIDVTPQADLDALSDGELGEDYLSTHRVFLANSTHTVYLGLTVLPGS